jgi:hypothetical protein
MAVTARHGMAWPGAVRPGGAGHGKAVEVWCGRAWRGEARRGLARHGEAWQSRFGRAGQGWTRTGEARLGAAVAATEAHRDSARTATEHSPITTGIRRARWRSEAKDS